ncbi:hypothetical protein [Streptomyces adustus]|uniref:hypothetical protein n=1 Tax=Streptomyces adustus TaxID=1609272 RepID=UPI00371736B6
MPGLERYRLCEPDGPTKAGRRGSAGEAWPDPASTRNGTALLAGVVFTVWFTWFLVTWVGIVESYPDPVCPGNVPPWWPSHLPT